MINWVLIWPKFNRPETGHAATADLPVLSQSFCNARDESETTVDGILNRHEQSLVMNHASWFRHQKLSRLARRSLADESEDGYDSLSESPGLELGILSPLCLYISGETSKRGRKGGESLLRCGRSILAARNFFGTHTRTVGKSLRPSHTTALAVAMLRCPNSFAYTVLMGERSFENPAYYQLLIERLLRSYGKSRPQPTAPTATTSLLKLTRFPTHVHICYRRDRALQPMVIPECSQSRNGK